MQFRERLTALCEEFERDGLTKLRMVTTLHNMEAIILSKVTEER